MITRLLPVPAAGRALVHRACCTRAVGPRGVALLVAALAVCSPASAQTFEGRVLGASGEGPIGTALVRLLDETGEQRAISIADAEGFYRLRAPEPGVYRIQAERIGYTTVESPLLEALRPDGVYPIDIEMAAAPVELQGLVVETDRLSEERADQSVQLIIGLSPKSLRFRPVTYETIQDHLDRAHDLSDVLRWEFGGRIIVRETLEGPCYSTRGYGCLPVYLNGLLLNGDFMPGVPLDMIYRVQVLTGRDGSVVYPAGAVLLYTEAWLR